MVLISLILAGLGLMNVPTLCFVVYLDKLIGKLEKRVFANVDDLWKQMRKNVQYLKDEETKKMEELEKRVEKLVSSSVDDLQREIKETNQCLKNEELKRKELEKSIEKCVDDFQKEVKKTNQRLKNEEELKRNELEKKVEKLETAGNLEKDQKLGNGGACDGDGRVVYHVAKGHIIEGKENIDVGRRSEGELTQGSAAKLPESKQGGGSENMEGNDQGSQGSKSMEGKDQGGQGSKSMEGKDQGGQGSKSMEGKDQGSKSMEEDTDESQNVPGAADNLEKECFVDPKFGIDGASEHDGAGGKGHIMEERGSVHHSNEQDKKCSIYVTEPNTNQGSATTLLESEQSGSENAEGINQGDEGQSKNGEEDTKESQRVDDEPGVADLTTAGGTETQDEEHGTGTAEGDNLVSY
jgi:hypothetical protein